jgi:hypothetical protein
MAAAAAWAEQDTDDVPEDLPEVPDVPDIAPITYSLHITQLAFNATDFDIRGHFVTKGCLVSSLRMVYDKGLDGRNQFRGVAFIDVSEKESYERALSLHKSTMLGRKINVRPTRTKEELSNIVVKSQEKVADKIRKQKEIKDNPAPVPAAKPTKPPSKRRRSEETDEKLTKKERNRRAAIIHSKRGRGRG